MTNIVTKQKNKNILMVGKVLYYINFITDIIFIKKNQRVKAE
jgi:hypothetical protein